MRVKTGRETANPRQFRKKVIQILKGTKQIQRKMVANRLLKGLLRNLGIEGFRNFTKQACLR
jgi:hypothetical protein